MVSVLFVALFFLNIALWHVPYHFLWSTQDLAVMLDKSREHLCSRGKMEIVENPVVINGDIPHMPSGQHNEDDIDIGKIQDEVGAIAKKWKGSHSLLLLVYV